MKIFTLWWLGKHLGLFLIKSIEPFDDLAEDNTHISAIVLFRFSKGPDGQPVPNNYIVTAYQKEIG
jgi:hypothetical protein